MWRFSLLSILLSSTVYSSTLQGVAVKGRFTCGSTPMSRITVKIVDKDPGRGDPDDLLDETLTDEDGRFQLSGATRENEVMEPAIKVYHDCNDEHKACQRKMKWDIPLKYTNNGTVTEWFDIGDINLELIFKDEERDCRHKRRRHIRHHFRENL